MSMFGYKCPECGVGVVRSKIVKEYRTKILGYPFAVQNAVIGVCDHCEEEHFSAAETKRWHDDFYRALESRRLYLSAEDITALRTRLGLTKEDFALLTGCTRQSLHSWEDRDRRRPQSRMADLLMKLVAESSLVGPVNAVQFLVREAEKLGIAIDVKETDPRKAGLAMTLHVRSRPKHVSPDTRSQLAAAGPDMVAYTVEDDAGAAVGRLDYDYEAADLFVVGIPGSLRLDRYNAEVLADDGTVLVTSTVKQEADKVVVVHQTDVTPDRVARIRLVPPVEGGATEAAGQADPVVQRLEGLLRGHRLLRAMGKSDEAQNVYSEICQLIFTKDFCSQIWDESVLRLLADLCKSKPPNPAVYGERVDAILRRADLVSRFNDLFFSLIEPDAPESAVVKRLSALLDVPRDLEASLVAHGKLSEIRASVQPTVDKLWAALEHVTGDLGVSFGAIEDDLSATLNAVRSRESVGRLWALVVHQQTGQAVAAQMELKTRPGNGTPRPLVAGTQAFEAAIRRAREALQDHRFIAERDDLLYGLDLTSEEYTGASLALSAAIGGYCAAAGISLDPYTAVTGDINLSGQKWRVGPVGGIGPKAEAAHLWGIRRLVLPKANAHELEEGLVKSIAVDSLLEAVLALQPSAQPVAGASLSVRKINQLRVISEGRGWQISPPNPVQDGLQFTVSPISPPDLKVVIYDSGAHSPKTHTQRDFQDALNELLELDQPAIPIRKVNHVLTVADKPLREEIRRVLEELRPSEGREELYCEYVFRFEDGLERLVVKQYQSAKLVLQGQAGPLLKRIFEAIASRYNVRHPQASLKVEDLLEANSGTGVQSAVARQVVVPFPYIGTDESGKGDFFGPMVVAGVWVNEETSAKLRDLGVKDSKLLSDKRCQDLAARIRQVCKGEFEEVEIPPERYNDLYGEFRKEGKNLNHLLAWGHARAIETLLGRLNCTHAVADQFGDENYIRSRLMENGKQLELVQLPRGERYIAVAAASVLTRDRFLFRLQKLGQTYAIELPKGASDVVVSAGEELVRKKGWDELKKVAKLHHRTTEKIRERL